MRFLSIFMVCVILTGCGHYVSYWRKEGATQEEERMIVKKCEYEAEAHSQEGLTDKSMREDRVRKLRDMCLEANGMVRVRQEYVPAN